MRTIIVSSHCTTGGIAAALKAIFPKDDIWPLPLPEFTDESVEKDFVEKINCADIWITIGGYHLPDKYSIVCNRPNFKMLRIPFFVFPSFHPDICYVKSAITNKHIGMPIYNSLIAAWSYKNNIDINDAARFFNAQTYKSIGYVDRWNADVQNMKSAFDSSDISSSFRLFIQKIKRSGIFMHSDNHPKAEAVVLFSKIISTYIGMNDSVYDLSIEIVDGLMEIIWPVYPEIAQSLSIGYGSYAWKFEHAQYLQGVHEFLEYTYNNYESINARPADLIIMNRDEVNLGNVLRSMIGV